MSSNLKNNTTTIQEILEMVNTLPEASSGGDGLPDGVSAIASGTFILAKDSISSGFYDIEHGAGTAPNFYMIGIEGSVGTELAGYFCRCYCMKTNIGNKGVVGQVYSLTESDGLLSYSIEFTTGAESAMFDDTKFSLYLSNRPLKAGYTYTWVCGVLDGIT